ncbi:hypothetical protein BDV28DRAFT_147355 [Aspergillus coremiiformis]|uniref:Uncharacterized protein n=1 Tax=Aspergillus coremiiformis TaxID=138285 RepID=A0A5N6ZBS4_9EURO|nr:hypothetical protein BDV28DRAFT_147355 [Aspergillus coremiiformis]
MWGFQKTVRDTGYQMDIREEFEKLTFFFESFAYDGVVPGERVGIHSELILMADKAFGKDKWKFSGVHEVKKEWNRRGSEEYRNLTEWNAKVRSRMTVEWDGHRVEGVGTGCSTFEGPFDMAKQHCREIAFGQADNEALVRALAKFGKVYPSVKVALEGHDLRD